MTEALDLAQVVRLADFMAERHAIYMRKTWLEAEADRPGQGQSARMAAAWGLEHSRGKRLAPLWALDHLTNDPILGRYRFCNVYRELDRVTVWIRENIREPFADHEHLWFMLAIARQLNWPETLNELIKTPGCWPTDERLFTPEYMTGCLHGRQQSGEKIYTGAYMIRAEQHDHPWRHWPKVRYTAEIVLGNLWKDRSFFKGILSADPGMVTLKEAWSLFQNPHYTGWGPFMAYQVVVDMRHTRYLRSAPDIGEWAAVGPGSARGLNRLHNRPVKASLRQEQALDEMLQVRRELAEPGMLAPWLDVPELSDVQNCLCEFDKYERVRLGEGRPRATYVPGRGS